MTDDAIIDGILEREGGYSEDAADRGGATKYGITAANLGAWRRLGRPASRLEVRGLKVEEAREIYRAQYVAPFAWVGDDALRAQLIDFGVNSGVTTVIRQLQAVLGVRVDGIAGSLTKAALIDYDARMVNNAMVGARVKFLEAIVDRDKSQLTFLHGWVRRAVGFFA